MPAIWEISNAGPCSRLLLEVYGATKKRRKIKDSRVIGVNGTGTKCAAVAGFRLAIGVGISSEDAQGPYFVWYVPREERLDGESFTRLVMTYEEGYAVPMPCFTTEARRWDMPIGVDTMRAFRVLREYLANGRDEDLQLSIRRIDQADLAWAPPGRTVVYLADHPDFEEMVFRKPERYFKWLSAIPPLFSLPNIGAIYPKSDPDLTRLFGQGVLAGCFAPATLSSCFDWNTENKERLSGDRELCDMAGAYADFHLLLRQIQDVGLAAQILQQAMRDERSVEFHSMVAPVPWPADGAFPARAVWLQAWQNLCGSDQAVLSSDNQEYDATAKYGAGKKIVRVASSGLRHFLERCGVSSAESFVPQLDPQSSYIEVPPNRDEHARLTRILDVIVREYPAAIGVSYYLYEPQTDAARRQVGLTDFDANGRPTRIGLQRAVVRGPLSPLIETILHELTHVCVPTPEHELPFVDYQDKDRGRLFMTKNGIADEGSLDAPAPDPTPETVAALRLIQGKLAEL